MKKTKTLFRCNSKTTFVLRCTTTVVASTFAASRLEEIQSLYHHYRQQSQHKDTPTSADLVEDGQPYASMGCRTSSRHLRRRATSHCPNYSRGRHRYPTATTGAQKARSDDNDELIENHFAVVVPSADENGGDKATGGNKCNKYEKQRT